MEPNPNSLLVWFPKVVALRLPHPRTKIVDVGWEQLQGLLDRHPLEPATRRDLIAAAYKIGFPLFMRTDLTSGKHHWKDACYVAEETDLLPNLCNLIDIEGCLDIRGEPSRAVVLREYVQLFAMFRAFRGLPIAPERRYFAEDGKVLCHHPYWTEDAIEKGYHVDPLPEHWRAMLRGANAEQCNEEEELTAYAEAITTTLPGPWSVDFAQTYTRKWLLIDMATAAQSWHPEDCPTQQKEASK